MRCRPQQHALFCYGTLLLPAFQRYLFGRVVNAGPATLHGWRVRLGQDGYRFIQPAPNNTINGRLIYLSAQQLDIADQWEEVPYYQRERVAVCGRGYHARVWVYTRRGIKGRPCPAHCYSLKPPGQLLFKLRRCTK